MFFKICLSWATSILHNLPFSLRTWLLIAWLLRFLACLVYYFLFQPSELKPIHHNEYQGLGTDGYVQIAKTLWLSGEYSYEVGGAPVHSRPPLHPFLLALTSLWSDEYWFFLWFIVSASLGTLNIYLTMLLSKRLQMPPSSQNMLLLVLVFHPYLIAIARSTTFIQLGTTCLLMTLYAYFEPSGRLKRGFCTGLWAGLSMLTHATFQLLPIALALSEMILMKSAKQALLILFTSIGVVLPWTFRNYLTFGEPIFLVTGAGMQYWKGEESAFPEQVDIYRKVYEEYTQKNLKVQYFCTEKPEQDHLLWHLGLKHLQENPLHAMYRMGYGIIIFLFPHETGLEKFIGTFVINFPLVLCLLWGFIYGRTDEQAKAWWLYFSMVIMAFAFFTPHASYIVMFLPGLWLFGLRGINCVQPKIID